MDQWMVPLVTHVEEDDSVDDAIGDACGGGESVDGAVGDISGGGGGGRVRGGGWCSR